MVQRRFRFVLLADTQLGCYAAFSGFDEAMIAAYAGMGMTVRKVPPVEGFEWDAARYWRAVELVNAIRPALVLIGGDLVDDPNSDDQTEEFLSITARIDPEVSVRLVAGNHDIAPDAAIPTPESITRYRDRFGPDWYSFTHDRTLFGVMNTPVIDHPELVDAEWSRQREFLDDEMSAANGPSVDHVVLVGHHPLFLDAPDESDTYWNLPFARRSNILERGRLAGVQVGFAGHWHRNHTAVGDGFIQVISGPVGYPLGEDPSGIRTVDVGSDGLSHEYIPLDMRLSFEPRQPRERFPYRGAPGTEEHVMPAACSPCCDAGWRSPYPAFALPPRADRVVDIGKTGVRNSKMVRPDRGGEEGRRTAL